MEIREKRIFLKSVDFKTTILKGKCQVEKKQGSKFKFRFT